MSRNDTLNYLTIHLHPGSISDKAYAAYELTGVKVSSSRWGEYWVDSFFVGSFLDLERYLESLYNEVCS